MYSSVRDIISQALSTDPLPSEKLQKEQLKYLRELLHGEYSKLVRSPERQVWTWCTISGRLLLDEDVAVLPIVPLAFTPTMVDYICGAGHGSRLVSLDNLLPICKVVDELIGVGDMAIAPYKLPSQPFAWRFVVLNESLLTKRVTCYVEGQRVECSIGALEGRQFRCRDTPHLPVRFLCFRYLLSLLHIKFNHPKHMEKAVRVLLDGVWPIEGPWLRRSFLRKYIGVVAGGNGALVGQLIAKLGLRSGDDQEDNPFRDNVHENEAESTWIFDKTAGFVISAPEKARIRREERSKIKSSSQKYSVGTQTMKEENKEIQREKTEKDAQKREVEKETQKEEEDIEMQEKEDDDWIDLTVENLTIAQS